MDPALGEAELDIVPGVLPLPGPLPDYSKFKKTQSVKVKYGDSQTESSLWWVPFRNTSLFEVGYQFQTGYLDPQYVCRPIPYCTLGSLVPGTHFCTYSLSKRIYTTKNFELLVNKDNFELLEWTKGHNGGVPTYGIKSCGSYYVGRHVRYGMGSVHPESKVIYIPIDGKEQWYYSYEVLTVVREPYNQHLSKVSYFLERANITRHQPHTLKRSKVTNNHDKAVKKTVSLSETTETVSAWETGFSTSLMLSSSISAGIPTIGELSVTAASEETISLSKSSSNSKSNQHSVTLEVDVPPGHSCEVKMEGAKSEVAIPFTAHVTKSYKSGKEHQTDVAGMYRRAEVGEINGVVEKCEPLQPVATGRVHKTPVATGGGPKGAAPTCAQAPALGLLVSTALCLCGVFVKSF